MAVTLVTAVRIVALFYNGLDLMFDEAQYWYWAQAPAFGYFSKPPMVAWAIWLTTRVCGEGEACVRLASPLAHAFTSIGIFLAAGALYASDWSRNGETQRRLNAEQLAFWSGITYLTTPAVAFSSTLISTDPLLLCFWAWTLYFFIRALATARQSDWTLAGIALGLGLLSKYAMLYFIPLALLALVSNAALRPHLRRPGFWSFLIVGLVFLVPNLLWNMEHAWVSVAHTGDNAKLGGQLFNVAKLGEFLGAQFAVFGPVLFAVLLGLGYAALKASVSDPRHRLLLIFSLPYLAFYLALSFVSRAHANWAVPTYVAGTILVVAWLLESAARRRWLIASLVLHVAATAALMSYPRSIEALGVEPRKRNDPFWRQRGQRQFGNAIAALLAERPAVRLLCDDREVIASLMYYVRPHPYNALKWDADGVPHDHFELMGQSGDWAGKDFLLVTEFGTEKRYAKYFESVAFITEIRIPVHSDLTLAYRVYDLRHFKGYGRARG